MSITSSYSNYGPNLQRDTEKSNAHRAMGDIRRDVTNASAPESVSAQDEVNMPSALLVMPQNELLLGFDRDKAEVAIRQLRREIQLAKEELKELEESLVQDTLTPSVRQWLLPLMVIGLLLSLYGSITSDNTAELGATGLMLLWSLSAFWFIYTRDRRLDMAKKAHKAEIEIWSNRISELEHAIEQNQQIIETTTNFA